MNILITRHDKIGDFVLALPMIKIAKNNFKGSKIIVLTSKVNFEFAKEIDFIDDVILYEKDVWALAQKIKKAKIDISISAFIDMRLGMALCLGGVKKRIAPATKLAQIFFNVRKMQCRSHVEKREFEYNIDLLDCMTTDIDKQFPKPLLHLDASRQRQLLDSFKQQYHIQNNRKIICFHPGSGGSSDGNLKLQDYVRLAESIRTMSDIQVIFTFGPDDYKSFELLKNHANLDVILVDSHYSLMDFCYLLSNFTILVSTSTGIMHLAGLVNTITFSFFGRSLFASAQRWGSINAEDRQYCFNIDRNYAEETYLKIEQCFKNLVMDLVKN